jgi:hypothetical protein
MAKKRSAKAVANEAAAVKIAAKYTGLSQADVKSVDKKLKDAGKRPLSFLASMLDKTRKHIPKLEADIARLAKKAK